MFIRDRAGKSENVVIVTQGNVLILSHATHPFVSQAMLCPPETHETRTSVSAMDAKGARLSHKV